MASLALFLNQLENQYHRDQYLSSDPLEFVHRYLDPLDQEAVALLAALLAYGNVRQIKKSVEDALIRIGKIAPSPREFVQTLPLRIAAAEKAFEGFTHRFNRGGDLVHLFQLLNYSWNRYGSLGGHFVQHLEPQAPTIEGALNGLISDWRGLKFHRKVPSTFGFLLTAPSDGSCCKRWCMFLRWMGRRDKLDLGLWTRSSPLSPGFAAGRSLRADQLIMPLDTHTARISQYLGLTQRKTFGWKTGVEVTDSLKKIDPNDPTRYDFALARLGILDICRRSYREEICLKCQLLPACHFAKGSSKGVLATRKSSKQRSASTPSLA